MITGAKDTGVMSEFMVFCSSDDCYDVEPDVGEEMTCGTGESEGGADDVLFFFQCNGLKGCCYGFSVSGLYFYYDKGVVTVIIGYDVYIFVPVVPIAGKDRIALLTEIFLCSVFSPFSEVIVGCHVVLELVLVCASLSVFYIGTLLYFPK